MALFCASDWEVKETVGAGVVQVTGPARIGLEDKLVIQATVVFPQGWQVSEPTWERNWPRVAAIETESMGPDPAGELEATAWRFSFQPKETGELSPSTLVFHVQPADGEEIISRVVIPKIDAVAGKVAVDANNLPVPPDREKKTDVSRWMRIGGACGLVVFGALWMWSRRKRGSAG